MNKPHSHTFRKTRAENLAKSAEDYTELVLDLISEYGEARVTEMARRLGVTHVTTLRTVKRLTRAGLLTSGPRLPIGLTPRGRKMALQARKKHQTLVTFLQELGVSRKIAENDAEGIEHHVSHATMRAIQRWINRLSALAILSLFGAGTLFATPTNQCDRIPEIASRVSALRSLSLLKSIHCREISLRDFHQFKEQQLLKATSPVSLAREELTFKMLGLIPENYPYAQCIAHSNWTDVMATYDAESETILLPSNARVSDEIIAHEIAHALQDQHFHLKKLQEKANRYTDSALALSALCEGDALFLQEQYHAQYPEPPQPTESSPERTPAIKDKCSLPNLLDQQNGFPYERGLRFIQLLKARRGAKSIDQTFLHPPRTTHEVLTPADYPLNKPNAIVPLTESDESIGEYTIFLILRQFLPLNQAILSAKGWRADRARLTINRGSYSLQWILSWASPEEAAEFYSSFNLTISKRFHASINSGAAEFQLSPREDFFISGQLRGHVAGYLFTLSEPATIGVDAPVLTPAH